MTLIDCVPGTYFATYTQCSQTDRKLLGLISPTKSLFVVLNTITVRVAASLHGVIYFASMYRTQ